MTDAQLSVLLYQYAARLTTMLEAAEDRLPDEAKTMRRSFIGPPLGPAPRMLCGALDDLRDFAHELKQDSELLELTARGEKPAAK